MDHIHEDQQDRRELLNQPVTTSSTVINTSTPCAKASKLPPLNLPTSITPVAVKQLFDCTSTHKVKDTWSSSLVSASGSWNNSSLEGFEVTGTMENINPSVDKSLDSMDMSKSLFSPSTAVEQNRVCRTPLQRKASLQSIVMRTPEDMTHKHAAKDTGIVETPDRPSYTCGSRGDVTQVDDDSLCDLLRTPPTLRTKRFSAPVKRKSTNDEQDLLSLLTTSTKKLCDGLPTENGNYISSAGSQLVQGDSSTSGYLTVPLATEQVNDILPGADDKDFSDELETQDFFTQTPKEEKSLSDKKKDDGDSAYKSQTPDHVTRQASIGGDQTSTTASVNSSSFSYTSRIFNRTTQVQDVQPQTTMKIKPRKVNKFHTPSKQSDDSDNATSTAPNSAKLSTLECDNVTEHLDENILTPPKKSGNHVQISTEHIQATNHLFVKGDSSQHLLDDEISHSQLNVNSRDKDSVKETISKSNGFKTASGNKVTVSDESMQAACFLLNNDSIADKISDIGHCSHKAGSFQTASGNPVHISPAALQQAKTLMNSGTKHFAQEKPHSTESLSEGFQSTSDHSVPVSIADLQEKLIESDNQWYLKSFNKNMLAGIKDTTYPSFAGFQTASGNIVRISEQSLVKARNLIDDMLPLEFPATFDKQTTLQGFQTGKDVNVSSNSLTVARNLIDDATPLNCRSEKDNLCAMVPEMNGFQTAAGKSVKISESSIAAAKTLLTDCGKTTLTEVPASVGFQTAAGKLVKISELSIAAAKTLLTDCEETSLSKAPACVGFQTAAGKHVKVSESSIAAAKTLLTDCEETSLSKAPARVGFQTAAGKPVNVSESSIAAAKTLLTDCEDTSLSETPASVGFQTAAGKLVKVSESSIAAAKTLLTDCEETSLSEAPACVGFQTAAGKLVEVSESSIGAARKLLSDQKESSQCKTSAIIRCRTKSVNHQRSLTPSGRESPVHQEKNAKEFCDLGKREMTQTVPTEPTVPSCRQPALQEVPSVDRRRSMRHKKVTKAEKLSQLSDSKRPISPMNEPVPRTPPSIDKSIAAFKSPIMVTPDDVIKNRSITVKPYWTNPEARGKKFTFGNKPFKAHTPNRQLLSHQLARIGRSPGTPGISKLPDSPVSDSAGVKLNSVRRSDDKINKPNTVMMSRKLAADRLPWRQFTQGNVPGSSDKISHLDSSILNMTSRMASQFRFSSSNNESIDELKQVIGCDISNDQIVDKETLYKYFVKMPGVDHSLVEEEWFYNHYRWIVWKLTCMERSFPKQCVGVVSPAELIRQMKYRYEREIDLCQRPALRKIYEKDDIPSKTMVLIVCSIKLIDSSDNSKFSMEVSDGWYSIFTSHDTEMDRLIRQGQVCEGTKLCVSGAQLLGCDQACPPLEAPECSRLKISTNSVRRARWDCRLGYQSHVKAMSVSLSSLLPGGGNCACVKLVILRKYPIVYMEKSLNGGTKFRNEVNERRVEREFQKKREQLMEVEMNRAQKNLKDTTEQKAYHHINYTEKQISTTNSGDELNRLVETSVDPEYTQQLMTDHQREIYMNYQRQLMEERNSKIQAQIRAAMDEQQTRVVTPMLKLKVAGLHSTDIDNRSNTILTIWRPTHDTEMTLNEGYVFNVYNLTVSEVRGYGGSASVLLSAMRTTVFEKISVNNYTRDLVYEPREITSLASMNDTVDCSGEFDVVGLVCAWEKVSQTLTVVYLTDELSNMVAVNFWGGFQGQGYGDVVKQGALLYMSNIQRGSLRYGLPCFTANELNIVTTRPSSTIAKKALDRLTEKIKVNKEEVIKACQMKLLQLSKSYSNHSTSSRQQGDKIYTPQATTPQQLLCKSAPPVQQKSMVGAVDSQMYSGATPVRIKNSTASVRLFPSAKVAKPCNDVYPGEDMRSQMMKKKVDALSGYGADQATPLSTIHMKSDAVRKPFRNPVTPQTKRNIESISPAVHHSPTYAGQTDRPELEHYDTKIPKRDLPHELPESSDTEVKKVSAYSVQNPSTETDPFTEPEQSTEPDLPSPDEFSQDGVTDSQMMNAMDG